MMDAINQIVQESAYEQGYADGFLDGRGAKVMLDKLREIYKHVNVLIGLCIYDDSPTCEKMKNEISKIHKLTYDAMHEYDDDLK